jgi:hypothetical protein
MNKIYYLLRGGDRNIYDQIPKSENSHRAVYAADPATALAWRNGAKDEEFEWDDVEYTVVRSKRVTTTTVQTVVKK